jgi:hypothetical protein
MRTKRKICGCILSAALVASSAGVLYACGDKPQLNENFEGRTVCYELPTDGSSPEEHSGVENIGYMAYRLKNQTNYYSLMEGTVDTIINQSVTTHKQYHDGIMIATDISISSLIKTAKQLCYVGDSVLWREAAKGAGEWDGLNTEWKTGEPMHVTTTDFKNRYGMPATEFSVYILNEDTIEESGDVVNNGDGTYSQTFRLSTDGEKAVYYYRQQMRETGGLDEWPEYESITVTYTFDSTWQILQSHMQESYKAKMVMSVGCTAEYVTTYEYNTDKAITDDYETFYSSYADKPASSPVQSGGLTPVGCLTQAFGGVLTGPTTFDLQLDVNGTQIDGALYLNVADMKNIEVRARLGNLRIWYTDGAAYLSYGNLKAKLTVSELMGLLQTATGGEGLSLDLDTNALLGQLGAGSFQVTESKATLSAALDLMGLHLPVVFSFDMQDGVPSLDYLGGVISLSENFNLGVTATNGTETLPALSVGDKAGYIEVSPYLEKIYRLFTQEAVELAVSYRSEKISVEGALAMNLQKGEAQGEFALAVNGNALPLRFAYADSYVYLDCNGLKGKVSATEAVSLLKKALGEVDLSGSFDFGKLLNTVLSDRFASLFAMNEGLDTLRVVVNGTQLFQELGLNVEAGSLSVAVSGEKVEVSAMGASIVLKAGKPFEVDKSGCVDLTPALQFVDEAMSVINEKQVVFDGLVELKVGDGSSQTVVSLFIKRGIVSWKEGFSTYFEASLLAAGTRHDFLLSAGKEGYALAYGPVGAAITQEELPTLQSALVSLYNRIAAVVNEIAETETQPLPQIQTLNDLLTLLKESELLASALQKLGGAQMTDLLGNLQLLPPEQANGVFKIAIGGFTAELLNAANEGYPELQVDYAANGVSLSVDMRARAYAEELPALPQGVSLMGVEELGELFDYAGSAAEMLTAQNLSLSLSGTVTSEEEAYRAFNGIKYEYDATVDYYSGKSFPLHIDLQNKNFWINPDLYAHITVDVRANAETDGEFNLDFLIVNGHEEDEELDLYLSVSRYRAGGEHAQPLKIYLPMSELATAAASVVSVLGVDIDFLNQTLVSSWLEVKTAEQLRALGKSLTQSFDFEKILGSLIGSKKEEAEKPLVPADGALSGLIKAVAVQSATETEHARLCVTLDSKMIYKKDMGSDLVVSIEKDVYVQEDSQKGYLSKISLTNVYMNGEGRDKIDFTCGISPTSVRPALPDLSGYYNGTGIGSLIKVVANSITTETEVISGEEMAHAYKINRNFYIEGNAKLSAFGILNATIDIVAISVTLDEEENVGINFRFEYQGVAGGLIEGDSTLDVTVKNGMVYMKRTQYTYFKLLSEKTYATPVVIYRAMPLENLFGDFLNQLKYMLNFGSTVTKLMNTESKPAEPLGYTPDLGAQAADMLSSFTYLQDIKDGGGNLVAKEGWKIVLNGDKMTDGVMGDLEITLKTNAAGDTLRTIDFNCSKLGISGVNLTANLIYRNPCGIMEKDENGIPVADRTEDISSLGDMLKEAIAATDWSQKTHLEAQAVTTAYLAEGNGGANSVIALWDTATNERLGGEEIPEVPARTGYTGVWGAPVGSNENGYTVTAVYTPNMYNVTLSFGEKVYETQLRYGAQVRFTAEGIAVATYTVTEGQNAFAVPAVPEKEGYTGIWKAVAVAENAIELQAQYAVQTRTVTLTSGNYVEGWSQENGLYVKRTEMACGGKIVFRFRGTDVAEYTVTEGENIVSLPKLPQLNGHDAVWNAFEWDIENTFLFADYAKDTVIYRSEVQTVLNGAEESFGTDTYALRTDASASGYRFLGWFVEKDNGWEKAETLSLTGAGAQIEVHALWAKDLTISVNCKRSGSLFRYQYTITASTQGGELVGAPASAVTVKTSFRIYLSMGITEQANSADVPVAHYDGLVSEHTDTTKPSGGKTCTHAVVDVTYHFNGQQIGAQHQFKSISSPMSNG